LPLDGSSRVLGNRIQTPRGILAGISVVFAEESKGKKNKSREGLPTRSRRKTNGGNSGGHGTHIRLPIQTKRRSGNNHGAHRKLWNPISCGEVPPRISGGAGSINAAKDHILHTGISYVASQIFWMDGRLSAAKLVRRAPRRDTYYRRPTDRSRVIGGAELQRVCVSEKKGQKHPHSRA